MSDAVNTNKISVLSIRNILLAITAVMVVAVVGLTFVVFKNATDTRSRAELSMEFNQLSDTLAELKIAVAAERTRVYIAYGFPDTVSPAFTNAIKRERDNAESHYSEVLALLDGLPEFPRKQEQIAALREAWENYKAIGVQVSQELAGDPENRELRKSKIRGSLNSVIERAYELRQTYETSFNTGDARIEAVKNLKRQLWLMIEYSAQDTAAIGENIASGEALSPLKLQTVSKYNGIVLSAWDVVQNIIAADVADAQAVTILEDIRAAYFDDFDLLRNDVYAAAEFEEPYPVTAEEWISSSSKAVIPLVGLSESANRLAQELNMAAVDAANAAVTFSIGGLVIVLLMGVASGWVILVRVTGPINALSKTMRRLASGKLDTIVPHTDGSDEVGDMARSVRVFKENAVERQRLQAEQLEKDRLEQERKNKEAEERRIEEENRRRRDEEQEAQARQERRQAMLDLADHFERSVMEVVEDVSRSASDMEDAARGMADTATQTSERSMLVTKVAEQASANINTVASAAEQLSSSVREITGQTTQSSTAARDAVSRTERASSDVSQLVEAAGKIGDVVQLINDIAEQTNLLALNATIEAARAGEAGKGFAVVASEVKSLANQTAQATQEISGQVAGMQSATTTAVKAMDQIRQIIRDIDTTAVSIASAVEEQDASTQEIARNVAEVSSGTAEVTSNIYSVSEEAGSTGAAASQVLSSAQHLSQQSAALKKQVTDFLVEIRA